jgi:hypothetical protein
LKYTDVSDVFTASIIRALMMEAILPGDYTELHPRKLSSSYRK